ncbi:hypothetical protein DPMN_175623 [Dreissena polymorpha]|uniref:Uncharacterized protein n=1 Tax=Dreissena polymorpha TaxID=45954 RepID=A0A9D4IIY1_DREPO|nr:hypothetical protein DPMN_175623 [Dreissena polymorpha]
MRLLNHLLSTGQIKRTDVEFYLAYTTKIFEFAENYEWNSVLNFDYSYRELKAEHAFGWGTFFPTHGAANSTPETTAYRHATHRRTLPDSLGKIVVYLKLRDRAPLDPSVGTVTQKPGQPPTSQTTVNTIYEPYLRSMGAEFIYGLL